VNWRVRPFKELVFGELGFGDISYSHFKKLSLLKFNGSNPTGKLAHHFPKNNTVVIFFFMCQMLNIEMAFFGVFDFPLKIVFYLFSQ